MLWLTLISSLTLLGCSTAEEAGSSGPAEPDSTPDSASPSEVTDPPDKEGPATEAGIADWTFLVFMNGDNDLEYYVPHDINELERAGSTERINVIVQADRAEGYWSGDGDWTGARRYRIVYDTDDTVIRSELVDDLGEVDMGDPQTLSDFLLWAEERYPAERVALVLWNHGDGWSVEAGGSSAPPPYISWDDDSGNSMSIAEGELADALADIVSLRGPLDVIGFDACNMGAFEIAHSLRNQALYMAGSESAVGNSGYQYDEVLLALQADPTADGADVADLLAWSAGDFNGEPTHSAIALSELDALAAQIDQLAGAVLADPALIQPLLDARDSAQSADGYWHDYYLDMADFAARLQEAEEEELSAAGQGITAALEDSIIGNYTREEYDFAGGLTLYADTGWVWLYGYAYGEGATWSAATRWDDLLVELAADTP